MEFTAQQIAAFVGGTVVGDANVAVHTFSKIEEAQEGSLTFLSNPKYTPYIYSTRATIVLVNNDFEPEQPIAATLIKTANAYESLARLMTLYNASQPHTSGISSLAYVDKTARIGEGVSIAPFAYVGKDVEIGEGTVLNPHVVIYDGCKIGAHCTLHAGCVIGADGFGFAPVDGQLQKISQIGNVILEGDNEIGANTCIDRAVMGHTVVGKGTKMDNLVQIGHNVVMEQNNIFCSQVGVAGTTKIGAWNTFAGQVGVAGQLTIGNQNVFGAQSGIPGNIKDGQVLMGTPVIPAKEWARQAVYLKRLPDMQKDINELKKNK